MSRCRSAVPAALAVGLLASPAWAHRVNVFAVAQGRHVLCTGYFASGAKPANCPIQVLLPDGSTLIEGRTNDQGQFAFEATIRADLTIVLDVGDGHRAEYVLKADKLPADLPGVGYQSSAASLPAPAAFPSTIPRGPGPDNSAPAAGAITDERLREIVTDVVARQLLPIQAQLQEARERRIGPTEVLGGIGFILGLLGVYAYARSRSSPGGTRSGSP